MKKKIMAMCLVIAMAATAVIGGTLAYFTDTDAETNVFVTGNVAIELVEEYEQNSKLLPAIREENNSIRIDEERTEGAENGENKYINGVDKEVKVKATGSEETYVRVHIAIPQLLDDGADRFDASKNIVHFNTANAVNVEGKWNWGTKVVEDRPEGKLVGEGDKWNYYEEEIDGIMYNVYVVTYETALAKDELTENVIHQLYMDPEVTNDDINGLKEELNDNWEIKVVAEGTQKEGFVDAFEALNAAFGAPEDHEFEWPVAEAN